MLKENEKLMHSVIKNSYNIINNTTFSKPTSDGRPNSLKNEEEFCKLLCPLNNNIKICNNRAFCDIEFHDPNTGEIFYIDIKIGELPHYELVGNKKKKIGTNIGYNVNANNSLLYCLTGKTKDELYSGNSTEKFYNALKNNFDKNCDKDYYFLFIDKHTMSAHMTSMRRLRRKDITINSSNPPFQLNIDNIDMEYKTILPINETNIMIKNVAIESYNKYVKKGLLFVEAFSFIH